MRLRKALFAVSLLILVPPLAFGLGTRVPDQDAEATARGGAFTATADNASAIFYNPAGIMQLGDGLTTRSGLYGISIDEQYDPLHGQAGAHSSTAHEPFQPLPQLFLSYHPKDQVFSFGIGIYSPFGLKTEWPDDASFRQAGVYGSLEYIAFNPVFAVQITRSLSVGIGVSANYVNAQLRDGLTPMEGDSISFKGDGLSAGGNAGILWKPTERQAIGFSYHSPVFATLTGHTQEGLNGRELAASEAGNAKIAAGKQMLEQGIAYINSLPIPPSAKTQLIAQATAQYQAQLAAAGVPASGSFPTSFPTLPAKGDLRFPQYAVLGYSFRPTPDWNLEADVDWTDWDSLNTFSLSRSGGSTVKVPFDWAHSFMYELGVTHTIGLYKISAGYIYSENSVPSATFSPLIPDSARNVFSIGCGRAFGRCEIDLAYQVGLGVTRTILNDSVADGRYSSLSNAVSISVGYHF
jgi:long-chain fatty acid transport protein